jgi:DNA-binding PadR family transcriptional regulator
MLELAILGFLREEDLHGYELKQRIAMLAGYYRRVSDGALYPAIARLERQGKLVRREETGAGAAPRQVLSLTPAGVESLLEWLRNPPDSDLSDRNRYFTLLAFLKYLTPPEQKLVLERRLTFLEGGRSFFQKDGKPVSLANETETSRVERAWLREMIEKIQEDAAE